MLSHLHHKHHDNNMNNPNNPNNTYNNTNTNSGYVGSNPSFGSNSSQSSLPSSSSMSHTFDADRDRTRMDTTGTQYGTSTGGVGTQYGTGGVGSQYGTGSGTTGTQYGTGTGTTGQYGSSGTGPYSSTGTGTGTYGSTGTTHVGSQPYGTTGTGSTGTTGPLIGSKYPDPTYNDTQQPSSHHLGGHHARTGTQIVDPNQSYSGTQQPLSGSQQGYTGTQQPLSGTQGYSGTQQPYSGTQQGYGSGMGAPGGARPTHTVETVTRDAQAQIDAQAEEAIRKSRELNAQDHARLQASIREATASLEEQARQLKQQIDAERLAAEQNIKQTQQQKLSATAQQQQLEEQKILEAAAKRKLELEQKAMRLQQEIDEIVRVKTAQMMQEKPAGNIGHVLDLNNSGRITEATMQPQPYMQQQQQQQQPLQGGTAPSYPVQAQMNTVQGQPTHEKKGGFFHALKTAITGHDSNKDHTTTGTNNTTGSMGTNTGAYPSQVNTNTTGMKQQPMVGNRGAYDPQSTWASNADKHMPTQ